MQPAGARTEYPWSYGLGGLAALSDHRAALARRRRDRCETRSRVFVADRSHPRCAIARRDVEMPAQSMRPSIVHIRRQCDGGTPREHGAFDIDVVVRKLRPNARVKRHLVRGGLS